MLKNDWKMIHDSDPILHQAAFVGDLERLQMLIEESGHKKILDAKNRLGCTALRLAATTGHTECLIYLIKEGANINILDIKAQTPLFVAVKNKHTGCIQALLEAGADPDGDLQNLATPLYLAARDGYTDGVEELLKYGAVCNRSPVLLGNLNSTPLYIAITYHHADCVKTLLSYGADPNNYVVLPGNKRVPPIHSLYHVAVKHHCENIYAQYLYEFGANTYARNEKGLHASEMGMCRELEDYIRHLQVTPRTLASHCRLRIRRCLKQSRMCKIPDLPLPKKLIAYLNYEDI